MLQYLIDKYKLQLKKGSDFDDFFTDVEFQKLDSISVRRFLEKIKPDNNPTFLTALFNSGLLNKLNEEDLYLFIGNHDGTVNLLWLLVFYSKKSEIFNNTSLLNLSSHHIIDLLEQPNEDFKGQNILLYIAENCPGKELNNFLSSPVFLRAKSESQQFLINQLHSVDDNDSDVLHTAAKNTEKFAFLINSPTLSELTGQDKHNLLFSKVNAVSVVEDFLPTDRQSSEILLNSLILESTDSNEKLSIIGEIKKMKGTVDNEDAIDRSKLEWIIKTRSFKSLDCSEKLDVVTCDNVDLLGADCVSSPQDHCHS